MPLPYIVFLSIFAIGLIVFAMTRSQWADQMTRLGKHQRRMAEKMNDDFNEDIFTKQKDDYLSKLLAHAGMESKYEEMKVSWVACTIGVAILLGAIAYSQMPELGLVGFIFGLPLGMATFVGYLNHQAKARQAKMTEQLPQILETMVSALRAGSPVMEVFKVLSETAPEPIRGEFKRGLVSLQLGKPFRDCLGEMGLRIRAPDFKLLSQAIFICQDVGGNLAEVVATIAEAIRERFKLRDFLNALTSQGKATAVFIGCLPYGITIMTYLATPGYIGPFLNHPIARIVIVCLLIWEAIGFWILVKMVTFEV